MTHDEFQRDVIAQAVRLGLHVHACIMRQSQSGFPDLVIIGKNGILWRELKIPPDRCTSQQRALGYRLIEAGQNWSIWHPDDLARGIIQHEMEGIK